MASGEFTINVLKRILREASGQNDGADVDVATMDTYFVQLGYDSLALLETGRRIERELGIQLDSSTLLDSTTPRALIDAVNAQLTVRDAS